ncbi:MAG TPA: Re/Si-specific NAD(P)(+) transhydrogenase subunit alpha [Thermoanaerobaculia bacterium]|nr:Re/Si-specific NAD(P)(+) transhydrogenase subunit alpha [Thermoanaerobaculia bacterium]
MPSLFIPKEAGAGETRVAATPESVRAFIKAGLTVAIESGAGVAAYMPDEHYREAGAAITTRAEGFATADVVAVIGPPAPGDLAGMKAGAILIGLLAPHRNLEIVRALAGRNLSSLALELIPRTSRAQMMDALSSQASIAGYKAVLLAATRLPRYFPLLMTAAGTIKPAKVVVMGAGVAGLQALATAKRLGAVVEVSDIRPAVKEQVQSLGGRFIDLPIEEETETAGGYAREVSADFLRKQREIVARHVAAADVVITTAQVPGKKAPVLVTRDMVEAMRPGSVIVDLAVDSGGNCEVSGEGEVDHHGVLILGIPNLAATMPYDASVVYARNVQALTFDFVKNGAIDLDLNNEIIRGALLTHGGKVVHAPTAELLKGTA